MNNTPTISASRLAGGSVGRSSLAPVDWSGEEIEIPSSCLFGGADR
jgi:hypothetical protein